MNCGRFRAIPKTNQLGRFPEIGLMIGEREVAQLGCIQSAPPSAIRMDKNIVRISSPTSVRQTIEIPCVDGREADQIVQTVNQQLQLAFDKLFGRTQDV